MQFIIIETIEHPDKHKTVYYGPYKSRDRAKYIRNQLKEKIEFPDYHLLVNLYTGLDDLVMLWENKYNPSVKATVKYSIEELKKANYDT